MVWLGAVVEPKWKAQVAATDKKTIKHKVDVVNVKYHLGFR